VKSLEIAPFTGNHPAESNAVVVARQSAKRVATGLQELLFLVARPRLKLAHGLLESSKPRGDAGGDAACWEQEIERKVQMIDAREHRCPRAGKNPHLHSADWRLIRWIAAAIESALA